MALTKVTGQVIKNTTDVTVGVLTVTNTLAVGGTVSIGGTLTYEDVTNVDAVGLVTARNGIVVGSGITLSKDGDGFFTGVTTATTFVGALTGNATGLSGTPNISVGTVSGTTGTFTSDVSIADKIVHTGDTNTLIRFPAAGTIRFDTDGNERARFDSGGRLLLKTTTEGHAAADDLTIENTASDMGITLRSSSSHQGAIYFSDGTSGDAEYRGIITYNHANDKLSVYTNASAALHITSNGDVGINASTINRADAGRNTIQFDYSGSDGSEGLEIRLSNSALNGNAATDNAAITYIGQDLGITNRENGNIKFSNNGSERLRIDANGKILIGDDTAENTIGLNARVQTFGTDASTSSVAIRRGSNDAQAAFLVLSKSRNTSVGSRTILQNGDEVGNIFFAADDGTDLISNTAAIKSQINGAPGANDTPGNLSFWTTSDGANSATQRMTIDSSGRLLVGQTSSISGVYGSPPPRFSVSTTTASPAIFATYSNDVYGSRIDLIKSRSTTVGGTTVVQANDAIGEIVFGGADGDQFHPTALIQSTVESGVGNNDMPGDLRFFTNAGATTATERARIDSAGNLKFNSNFGSVQTAYGVRAWVFINNTSGSMTPYTDGSGGVSSVDDLANGSGRVNFSITMPNTAYAIVNGFRREGTYDMVNVGFSNATTSFRFDSFNDGSGTADLQAYSFVIVR